MNIKRYTGTLINTTHITAHAQKSHSQPKPRATAGRKITMNTAASQTKKYHQCGSVSSYTVMPPILRPVSSP